MTLIVALKGKDFVVMASDSKGTRELENTRVDSLDEIKLVQISKYVCALIADDGEIGTELVDSFRSTYGLGKGGVNSIAKKFSVFCKNKIRHISSEIPLTSRLFPVNVDYILAGLDKQGNQFKPEIKILRSMNYFFPGRKNDKATEGSSLIADYILGNSYDKDANQTDMCYLAAKVINETIKYDGYVGGKIKMAVIDDKGFRELNAEYVDYFSRPKEENELKEVQEKIEKVVKG